MSDWTEEEEAGLGKYYAEGYSASQIARLLNEKQSRRLITRNAVIGKIARLGDKLPGRAPRPKGTNKVKKREAKRSEPSKPSIVVAALAMQAARRAPPSKPLPIIEPMPTGLIGVMELTSTTCRWPIGDPGAKDFHFCGAKMEQPFSEASPNTAYCQYHSRVAYNGFTFGHDPAYPRIPFNQWNKMGKVA